MGDLGRKLWVWFEEFLSDFLCFWGIFLNEGLCFVGKFWVRFGFLSGFVGALALLSYWLPLLSYWGFSRSIHYYCHFELSLESEVSTEFITHFGFCHFESFAKSNLTCHIEPQAKYPQRKLRCALNLWILRLKPQYDKQTLVILSEVR